MELRTGTEQPFVVHAGWRVMTQDHAIIFAILFATVAMFMWGRWRHDMVALGALLACVLTGLVPASEAFAGFGHPAVITVACILILSHGLQTTGMVDTLAQWLLPGSAGQVSAIAILTGLAAVLSAFMNNVGALALLMPVAIQFASRQDIPPGRILMPLAVGSILGGMTTLIGTPPNLIVSGFRADTGAGTFAMFDFTPVGIVVAATGIVFVILLGWRLVPTRERAGTEGFETGAYLTEARIPDGGKSVGMSLQEIEKALEEADAQVIGLIRDEIRMPAPNPFRKTRAEDILIIEAEPEALASALSALGLKLEEAGPGADDGDQKAEKNRAGEIEEKGDGDKQNSRDNEHDKAISSDDIVLMELAVLPDSNLIGHSATDIRLRDRYGINLLAVSRQGRRSMSRLRSMPFQAGDVLLMQGAPEVLSEFASGTGCVPLAERALYIPDTRKAVTAVTIMGAAVSGAAFGLLPAAIAFAAGVLAAMALRVVSPRNVYAAVDWPVIVLLGALLPVAGAMADSGASDLIARGLLELLAQGNAVIALAAILVVTMTLSDFMNNAATAAMMCPIAIGTAAQLGTNADPFLMAVAVGASCAFLTPIGHQNNTLILGPGGFRFGDYWRMGLPLEIIVIAAGIPMILMIWPL